MKFNELELTSNRSSRRVGRGIAAGQGKTAGRGTKGQKARTGNGRRPGFEGGQNPLVQRLPKLPGFRSNRTKPENINTTQLNKLNITKVDNFSLFDAGLVSSPHVKVKLLYKDPLAKKLDIRIQSASARAIAEIEKTGGSFTQTPQVGREAKDKTK